MGACGFHEARRMPVIFTTYLTSLHKPTYRGSRTGSRTLRSGHAKERERVMQQKRTRSYPVARLRLLVLGGIVTSLISIGGAAKPAAATSGTVPTDSVCQKCFCNCF